MLLQDENDNAPIFEQDKYTFKIKENNDPGAILATLRATDADVGENGEVRYTIAGEDAEAFSVNEITGSALYYCFNSVTCPFDTFSGHHSHHSAYVTCKCNPVFLCNTHSTDFPCF